MPIKTILAKWHLGVPVGSMNLLILLQGGVDYQKYNEQPKSTFYLHKCHNRMKVLLDLGKIVSIFK